MLDYTQAEIIEKNIDVPDAYIDKDGGLFFNVTGERIPSFVVDYLQNSKDGTVYAKTSYTVTIVPVDAEPDSGEASDQGGKENQNQNQNKPGNGTSTSGSSPATGDTSKPVLWLMLAALSGIAMLVSVGSLCNRKRKQ